MQTPKTRTGSLEVPQRTSPATPRTSRQLKAMGSDSDSVQSPNPASRTPKDRSPKVVDRRSSRSPASDQKKLPSKVSELESQLAQLQEELKKAKDQLSSSESYKKRAEEEAEEAKKQLAATSAMLKDSQQQLMELSDSDDARVQELRKISQERDRAWQSELEAVQKQHSMDSAALSSAMNEIQRLKMQLERVAESEAAQAKYAESAHAEIQNVRLELEETLSLVENLKTQLSDCKESETRALEFVSESRMKLEMAKETEEMLRSEGLNAMEAYKGMAVELEQSKDRGNLFQEQISKLQAEGAQAIGEHEDPGELKEELNKLKFEVGQLRSALDAAERRYQEEYIQSTLEIRSAYELAEHAKSEASQKEAELDSKLMKATEEIQELKANLVAKETELQSMFKENVGVSEKIEQNLSGERESMLEMEKKKVEVDLADLRASLLDKENELQSIKEENEMMKFEMRKREVESNEAKDEAGERESMLEMEKKKVEVDFADLRASLLDKENELQSIKEENEMMKFETRKREVESNEATDEALALAESAKTAEREALMKLGFLTEEADKSSRKVTRVIEQLDASQAANAELEAELRRLKVQSDQWRKAAEAAAAMLSSGNNNGKLVERTGSLDYHTIGGKLGSPFSEDLDDESPKKKNGSVFKKIGVMLKKGQK